MIELLLRHGLRAAVYFLALFLSGGWVIAQERAPKNPMHEAFEDGARHLQDSSVAIAHYQLQIADPEGRLMELNFTRGPFEEVRSLLPESGTLEIVRKNEVLSADLAKPVDQVVDLSRRNVLLITIRSTSVLAASLSCALFDVSSIPFSAAWPIALTGAILTAGYQLLHPWEKNFLNFKGVTQFKPKELKTPVALVKENVLQQIYVFSILSLSLFSGIGPETVLSLGVVLATLMDGLFGSISQGTSEVASARHVGRRTFGNNVSRYISVVFGILTSVGQTLAVGGGEIAGQIGRYTLLGTSAAALIYFLDSRIRYTRHGEKYRNIVAQSWIGKKTRGIRPRYARNQEASHSELCWALLLETRVTHRPPPRYPCASAFLLNCAIMNL